MQANRKKLARIAAGALVAGALFFAIEPQKTVAPATGSPPIFYATRANDNLRRTLTQAIDRASQSVFLKIYSMNDPKVISSLNERAKTLDVKVIHDCKTSQKGFNSLTSDVEKTAVKTSGLMHQKILVCDESKIYLGSANMTTESLRLHDNLVIGLDSPALGKALVRGKSHLRFAAGGQQLEYFAMPQSKHAALEHLISLIDQAKESIRVAMFTWTHPTITDAIIAAAGRGVMVEILLDRPQSLGAGAKELARLKEAGLKIHMGGGVQMLHHKCAWIDRKTLVNGSANWTRSAFTRNHECFLVIYDLSDGQNAKLEEMWKTTWRITQ